MVVRVRVGVWVIGSGRACWCSVVTTVRKAERVGVARPLSTERSMPSKPYLALSSAYLVRVRGRGWGWG